MGPPALSCWRWMPSGERFRRDPNSSAATLLQRLVVRAPVADSVLRLRKLMAACFVHLIRHLVTPARAFAPILSLPKRPPYGFMHQRRTLILVPGKHLLIQRSEAE